MKRTHTMLSRFGKGLLAVLFLTGIVTGQDWKRVQTGEYSTVDIDASSIVFGADSLVSAKYRTVLEKAESLQNDPALKYKTRIDTIEFTSGRRYRYAESTLLSSDGKIILTKAMVPRGDWRAANRVSNELFQGLNNSPIFTRWTVFSYHFIGPKDQNAGADTTELNQLLGSEIKLYMDSAWAGDRHCMNPGYESRKLTDTDLEAQLGAPIGKLGVAAKPVGVIAMTCGSQGWQPSKSLLISLADGRLLMLWDGVFLELVDKSSKRFPIPVTDYDSRTRTLNVSTPPDR